MQRRSAIGKSLYSKTYLQRPPSTRAAWPPQTGGLSLRLLWRNIAISIGNAANCMLS